MAVHRDLDEFLYQKRATLRLECSTRFAQIEKYMSKKTNSAGIEFSCYERKGLGSWNAFGLSMFRFGPVFVGAPSDDALAGCSMWMAPQLGQGRILTLRGFAIRMNNLLAPIGARFMDPANGELFDDLSNIRPRTRLRNVRKNLNGISTFPLHEDEHHLSEQ